MLWSLPFCSCLFLVLLFWWSEDKPLSLTGCGKSDLLHLPQCSICASRIYSSNFWNQVQSFLSFWYCFILAQMATLWVQHSFALIVESHTIQTAPCAEKAWCYFWDDILMTGSLIELLIVFCNILHLSNYWDEQYNPGCDYWDLRRYVCKVSFSGVCLQIERSWCVMFGQG